MCPKIPPFPPREFATIDEILAGGAPGHTLDDSVTERGILLPGEPAENPGKVYIVGGGSSRAMGSTKPRTIIAIASSSLRPRCIR